MTITAPQSRLILKTIMSTLRNNLASANMIEWEMHSTEMNDRNGFVVSEQVSPDYVITETDGAVADLSTGVQDTVFGAQTFTLNKVFGLSMGASDIEAVKTLQSARKNKALSNGISRLASRIDYHIFDVAAKGFNNSVGTWGQDIDTPVEFASARTRLALGSLESDQDIVAALSHTDHQQLATYIYDNNAALADEGSVAMRKGFRGLLDGIPIKATNQLGRITTGDRSSTLGAINGAAQNVNYSAAADAGANAGYYMTQELLIDTIGFNTTISDGEVFTIAGVNAYDPEIRGTRGYLQNFVVVGDVLADGAGLATVRIFPAIIVDDQSSVIGAAAVNRAHATVDAAPADGAIITFNGAPSTQYIPKMMWKKEAIVAHSAPLIMPYTGQGFRRSLADAERDTVAPLMPRLWFYSEPATGAHKCRVDMFIQAQMRNRWMGVKFFGLV
jgi:hypothetical protein